MVTCTGHIGIHEGADGRTYVRTFKHSGQTSAHVRALEWRKGCQNGGASLWAEVVTLKSPHRS